MAQKSTKILEYCKENGINEVDFLKDVLLQDDGDGVVYIAEWNLNIAQPTDEQIESYETVANETEANTPTKSELKASAKQKLIAGEPLTEEEADTIVL